MKSQNVSSIIRKTRWCVQHHVRLTLASSDGTRIKAIAFRALGTDLGELLLSERQHPLHIAGRLVVDDWGSERVPSLHIEDVARVG